MTTPTLDWTAIRIGDAIAPMTIDVIAMVTAVLGLPLARTGA